jgi:hypothetical protein
MLNPITTTRQGSPEHPLPLGRGAFARWADLPQHESIGSSVGVIRERMFASHLKFVEALSQQPPTQTGLRGKLEQLS